MQKFQKLMIIGLASTCLSVPFLGGCDAQTSEPTTQTVDTNTNLIDVPVDLPQTAEGAYEIRKIDLSPTGFEEITGMKDIYIEMNGTEDSCTFFIDDGTESKPDVKCRVTKRGDNFKLDAEDGNNFLLEKQGGVYIMNYDGTPWKFERDGNKFDFVGVSTDVDTGDTIIIKEDGKYTYTYTITNGATDTGKTSIEGDALFSSKCSEGRTEVDVTFDRDSGQDLNGVYSWADNTVSILKDNSVITFEKIESEGNVNDSRS